MPEGQYAEVTYEDLQVAPTQEVARLFDFLGVAADKKITSRCVKAASFERLSGRKPGGEDYVLDFKKQRKGVAGDWRNVFTKTDKHVFKETAGDLLVDLGYEKDLNW